MLEFLKDYGVSPVFNICDVSLFTWLQTKDLRTNHFQEGGYDEGVPERQYIGPIKRSRAKGIEEEENFQKTFLLWKVGYEIFFSFV